MQCDGCDKWCHRKCGAEIPRDLYRQMVRKSPNVFTFIYFTFTSNFVILTGECTILWQSMNLLC